MNAFAHNQLGEFVVHHGTYQGQGIKLKTWYAMYSEARMMIRTETTIAGSGTQIEDEWIDETEIFNHGTAQQILTLCQALGGQLENITIALGTFNTCKVRGSTLMLSGYSVPQYLTDADIWLGDFPVTGVAKAQGADFSMELASFKWN